MPLGWKTGLVFGMMLLVGVLMIVARKRNFEGVRRHYTTRRQRVPVDPKTRPHHSAGDAHDEKPSPPDES